MLMALQTVPTRPRAGQLRTILLLAFLFWPALSDAVFWEGVVRTGYDSNVNRAINDPKSDHYLLGSLSLNRLPSGESRLDWIFSAGVEGAAYNKHTGLNYGLINVSPGLSYSISPFITLTVSPFGEAKTVSDSEQSALTGGGKVMLRERIGENIYLGEYYLFRSSSAHLSTYSFTENAVGIFAGTVLFKKVSGEIGYEYSYGDSYLNVGRGIGGGQGGNGQGEGQGPGQRQSGPKVVREPVHRQALGANLNVDWTGSIFSMVSYVYTSMMGHSGTAISHAGFVSLGYRF
jgi:hypothetical protein